MAPSPTRLRILLAGFLVLSLVLVARLAYWQVVRRDALVSDARAQVQRSLLVPATRGLILDRNGAVLAATVSLQSIYAIPQRIPDRAAVARALAPVLREDANALLAKLESGAEWLYLRRRVPEEVSRRVRELALPGIGFQPEPKRVYPHDRAGAALLGFVTDDGDGEYGIEGRYDGTLGGRPGRLVVERDPQQRSLALGLRQLVAPLDGSDVVLTIDLVVQAAAERELARAMERERAKGGAIVVLDPDTGAVLALASAPGYDASDVRHADPESFRDRAISWTYEPGSTLKTLTIAAALNEHVVAPATSYVDKGYATIGGRILRNARGSVYGRLDVSGILEKSANAGAVFVAERLGAERLHRYLTAFGLGERTGVDLAAEASGILRPLHEWYPVDLGTASFGQGVSVTPLQLAAAYGALATGGTLYRPYVVAEVRGVERVDRATPRAVRRVIGPETAATVREMLTNSVDRGIANAATLAGYSVAGKTGTAQIASADGRYLDDEVVSSFVGMVPARDPRFVCVVVLERPASRLLGTLTAMAAFRGTALDLLRHARVEPDRR